MLANFLGVLPILISLLCALAFILSAQTFGGLNFKTEFRVTLQVQSSNI
jgi:hypothetical protein